MFAGSFFRALYVRISKVCDFVTGVFLWTCCFCVPGSLWQVRRGLEYALVGLGVGRSRVPCLGCFGLGLALCGWICGLLGFCRIHFCVVMFFV